ncbi:hypothetical protein ACJMK2_003858 [Sinanodonta woodiana]|uniref:THAP-type domain-containing protein n=1 Tax=Sinanodonta woodiana TaxID=1069815 RepID=A0ABD3Y1Q2_SINWO
MTRVFWIKFPKPIQNLDKSQRWVRACGRENFTTDKITRWTYICSKHFVGGNGPTTDYPDPIPATLTPNQKKEGSNTKSDNCSQRLLMEVAEVMVSLQDNPPLPDSSNFDIPNKTPYHLDTQIPEEESIQRAPPVCDAGTQTTYLCSDVVANKIERRIRNNDSQKVETSLKKDKTCVTKKFYFASLSKNEKLF